MQTINYYWYHHMMPKAIRESVQKVIDEKDFEAFMFYEHALNKMFMDNGQRMIFLPMEASIFEDDEYVKSINIFYEENFMKIDYSESECG